MDSQFLLHALNVLVSISGFFLVPALLSLCFNFHFGEKKIKSDGNLFAWTMAWLLILVITWANVFTGGGTLLNGILFVLGLTFYFQFKASGERVRIIRLEKGQNNYKVLLHLVYFILFFFCIRLFFYIDPQIGFTRFGITDYVIYAKDAAWIKMVGVENVQMDISNPSGSFPYHYFDLWLYSIFGTVLKFNSSSLIGGAGTVLLVISALGSAALLPYKFSKKWYVLVIIPFIFLYSGFYFVRWQSHDILHFVSMYSVSLFGNPRHCLVFLCFLLAFGVRKKELLAFGFLLVVPFISIVPAIGVGVFLSLIVLRQLILKGIRRVVPLVLLCAISLILFCGYHIDWIQGVFQYETQSIPSTYSLTIRDVIYKLRQLMLRTWVAHFLVIVLSGLMLWKLRKKTNILIWFGVFSLFTVAVMSLVTSDLNGFQMYTNILIPIIPLIILMFLLEILLPFCSNRSFKIRWTVTTLICGILVIFQIPEIIKTWISTDKLKAEFDHTFIESTFKTLDVQGELALGGALVSPEYLEWLISSKNSEGAYPVGIELVSYKENCLIHTHAMNLAEFADAPFELDYLEKNKEINPFTRAALEGKELSRLSFPSFIIAENDSLLLRHKILDSYERKFNSIDNKYIFYSKSPN